MVSKFADDKKLTHQSRRTFLWSETGTVAALILRSSNAALVDVKLVLSNIKAFPIPCPGSFLNLKLKKSQAHLCV